MERLRYILTLILVLTFGTVFAHRGFFMTATFGNVKVRISTDFKCEEVEKVLLFGELASLLAYRLDYSKPIFLDFIHYSKECEAEYFISYDKGGSKFGANKEKNFLKNKSIVVRQVARQFDAQTTLKLLEYSILNIKNVKSSQKEIESNKNYFQWKINTIDTTLIKEILNKQNSIQINNALSLKCKRREKNPDFGISYYLQDNKYTIYLDNSNKAEIKNIITFDNIYDFQRVNDFSAIVFDTDSSFYFIQKDNKKQVSEKHIIQPPKKDGIYVEDVGEGKISIFSWGWTGGKKTLIYLIEEDKLINDEEY